MWTLKGLQFLALPHFQFQSSTSLLLMESHDSTPHSPKWLSNAFCIFWPIISSRLNSKITLNSYLVPFTFFCLCVFQSPHLVMRKAAVVPTPVSTVDSREETGGWRIVPTPTYTCLHSPRNESRDKLDEKRMDAPQLPKLTFSLDCPRIDSLSCIEFFFFKRG